MSSDLQHLPPGMVAYLDALSRRGDDPKALHGDFLTHLELVGEWVTNLSGYTMDDAEIDEFANVSALLESLRSTAEEVTWGEQLPLLLRDLYPMLAFMDRINKRREVAHHSPQPAVNDFLLCGVAFLKGRARWPALENRLDKLEHYTDNLESALAGVKARLKPEVVESLQKGLALMREGMDGLDPEKSESQNQDSLALISEGAKIMQFLIDWQRADDERFAAQHQRFLIPAAGPVLESFLEHLDGLGRTRWGPALETIRQQTIPQFQSEWWAIRRRIFMHPDQRESVWNDVEAAVDELQACLDDLADPSVDEDEAIDACEDAVVSLSQQFQALQGHTRPYAHLYGSEPGILLEGIFGALGGTVPARRLAELPANGAVAQFIRRYAADGNNDHLFRAGYALLTEYPPPAEVAERSWTCPYCNCGNPLGVRTCAGCHATPSSTTAIASVDSPFVVEEEFDS